MVKTNRGPLRITASEIMIRLDNDCFYRNKLDHHKRNICKTNTLIWKENFEDDCEIIKTYKKKTVFAPITMKKSAAQHNN